MLIEAGADVLAAVSGPFGRRPLHLACSIAQAGYAVSSLLKHGGQIRTSWTTITVRHFTWRQNVPRVVKPLNSGLTARTPALGST